MIARKPVSGDTLEISNLFGGWAYWGTVDRVEGATVYRVGGTQIDWCFGFNGCLGNNVVFRICAPSPDGKITMDDPAFY